MKTFTKKLPLITDLQPEPQDVVLRLPPWMKYLFILLYIVTLSGMALLLRESIDEFKLYQDRVQAEHIIADTTRQINALQARLTEDQAIQKDYDNYKLRQKQNARPGVILNWIPSLITKLERAHTITVEQKGDVTEVRIALEKPIAENTSRITNAPQDLPWFHPLKKPRNTANCPRGRKPTPTTSSPPWSCNLRSNEYEYPSTNCGDLRDPASGLDHRGALDGGIALA